MEKMEGFLCKGGHFTERGEWVERTFAIGKIILSMMGIILPVNGDNLPVIANNLPDKQYNLPVYLIMEKNPPSGFDGG